MLIQCFFNCIYCRYFVGSESDRNRHAWAYLSGLIVLIGTPLHPELEKPIHSLISVLRGTDKSLFAHN